MSITVRAVAPEDHDAWAAAYRGYRDFYEQPHDQSKIDLVWSWLSDPGHEVRCIVAEQGGRLVGLAHYRRFARPLAGGTGIYLDDLFTTPEARGHGVGSALIGRLDEIAVAEGASVVRWITAADNATARSVYDRVAAATPWVTYDLAPGADRA